LKTFVSGNYAFVIAPQIKAGYRVLWWSTLQCWRKREGSYERWLYDRSKDNCYQVFR